MPKKAKSPKVSPEELLEALRQAEEERCAEEQDRLHGKVALELKEYNQRRMLLVETVKFFRRLEKAAIDNERQLADRKEWTDFLACRTSPDPVSPPKLRECLFRWTFQQEAQEKSSVSWTLAADERSPLTQDPSRKRNTRKDLREIFRNIGGIYLPTIREALAVLASIQKSVGKERHEISAEVALVRDEIRKFISDSLDRMTFRIGSNIARDMETLDPVMSDFHFQEDNVLAMYLWSFRPVPLAPDYNLLMKVVNMVPLNLVLHRPSALELKDCLIRGMWLEFDHYSNMDPTHTIPLPETIPELIPAQETEWNERQEVKRKRLAALRKLREDYDTEQRRKQAEAEALEAQKGGPGAGKDAKKPAAAKAKVDGKKGKAPKQPPVPESVPAVITDETEVDIDAEFEQQEADRFWDTLAFVSPKSLPLREGYINLREYAIVGGVFKLARFDKLPQPMELRPDFIYINVPVGLKLTEKVYRAFEPEELIKIELQLPAHCHWWDEPTVCWWERWEEGEQFIQLSPELQQFHLKYDEIEAHKAMLLFAAPEHRLSRALTGEPKLVQDFNLVDIPVELRLHYLIREHLLPRVPEGYRFRAELKRLYTILTERAERQKARDREQMARDGMMQKYEQFLTENHHYGEGVPPTLLSEMRLPIDSDIDPREESDTKRTGSEVGTSALQEMDEKLQQFSLAATDEARYLHPPVQLCQPLVVGRYDGMKVNVADQVQEMEALVQRMESTDAMLDNDSNERLCKMFSTLLLLLEYLREKEKPTFPALPLKPREDEAAGDVSASRSTGRQSKQRRLLEIRTTKKHPLGLGGRTRTLSGMSEAALALEEKKKRKRKKSVESVKAQQERSVLQDASQKAELGNTSSSEQRVMSLIEHEPGRWSTMPIRSQSYDPDQRLLTFYTDRLGVYGLAARKYCNIPFVHWNMRRHGRIANLTTTITLSSKSLQIVFYITAQGYRLELQELGKKKQTKKFLEEVPPPHLLPADGTFSLEELEKFLQRMNVHLFPQVDTCFYVTGMEPSASPKHPSMERHNLRCLGVFCLTHNFQSCLWNRYANRRTALVLSRELIEGREEPEYETVMITPLKSQFVEVEELCSDSLEEILLAYHPRPEEQSYNADCYGLLKDSLEEPSRKVLARTPALLQWNVGQLLQKLQLLSYS
uniref:IC97/Casc1 N-terminal domain-containing protein n=1 Tax=Anopheles christyi TaxID=43041 RepID=A0A182JYA7_9DIPT